MRFTVRSVVMCVIVLSVHHRYVAEPILLPNDPNYMQFQKVFEAFKVCCALVHPNMHVRIRTYLCKCAMDHSVLYTL